MCVGLDCICGVRYPADVFVRVKIILLTMILLLGEGKWGSEKYYCASYKLIINVVYNCLKIMFYARITYDSRN